MDLSKERGGEDNGFYGLLRRELERIDRAGTAKRQETIIEGFTDEKPPRAIIAGKPYRVFNSNDYLGLRHSPLLKKAEQEASEKYGAGPGAVRFISGSLKIHRDLERALAVFHGRDDAMIFSSAFAANVAVLGSLIKGQSKDSLIGSEVLVISDELIHRSLIEGIRTANLPKEQRRIFLHRNLEDLNKALEEGVGRFRRALVVTDGVFSMLGIHQDLAAMEGIVGKFRNEYPEGIITIIDDCHGIGAFGLTGRGCEEVGGVQADVLIGTMGKALGADGGYVAGNQVLIDYLRESAATYIYSNNISPGTAGAAHQAVQLISGPAGSGLLEKLRQNTAYFKKAIIAAGFSLAADSDHPIQPILVGDSQETVRLKKDLFDQGFLVTNINYPVVPIGRDEIRVQISAAHQLEDIDEFAAAFAAAGNRGKKESAPKI